MLNDIVVKKNGEAINSRRSQETLDHCPPFVIMNLVACNGNQANDIIG
jgi:hypothetical protein